MGEGEELRLDLHGNTSLSFCDNVTDQFLFLLALLWRAIFLMGDGVVEHQCQEGLSPLNLPLVQPTLLTHIFQLQILQRISQH